jgi:hypothetical protein
VRYVLEGSVRKVSSRVRIGIQLADAGTGRQIWAERYERALADLFALQDEIAASVVVAVEPQLYAAESERVQQKSPGRLDTWDFDRGRYRDCCQVEFLLFCVALA